jgi:3-hydroxybutyrate dehydrogenase
MSDLQLSGKCVVITGASRGIGLGIARGFAAAGARLHLIADDAAVTDVAHELRATGHVADITDARAIERVFETIGRHDVLINNAGLERITPLADTSDEVEGIFRRIVEINIVGTYLATRAALPRLVDGGAIINTASVWSRSAEAGFAAYVASKHATVDAVCPGWVKTGASMLSLKRMSERSGTPELELLDAITGAQILPGLMEPEDVAGPYLFLASPLAANITGQSIGVDRGEVPW